MTHENGCFTKPMGVFGQCQIWCSFGFLHLTRRESPALHELFVRGLKKLTNRNEDNLFFAYGTLLSLRSKFRSEKQAWYQPKHPTSNFQTLPKVSQIKALGNFFCRYFSSPSRPQNTSELRWFVHSEKSFVMVRGAGDSEPLAKVKTV